MRPGHGHILSIEIHSRACFRIQHNKPPIGLEGLKSVLLIILLPSSMNGVVFQPILTSSWVSHLSVSLALLNAITITEIRFCCWLHEGESETWL